jgi:hypothetical protein
MTRSHSQGAMPPPQDGPVRDMIRPPSIEVSPSVVASLRQVPIEHVPIQPAELGGDVVAGRYCRRPRWDHIDLPHPPTDC